jgi:hypothetical protein
MADRWRYPPGREGAVALVRELMDRPVPAGKRRPESIGHPVLVIEGPAGSGTSTVLGGLTAMVDGNAPWALIDFRTRSDTTVPAVLSAVAVQFGRPAGRYPGLRFPRLALALMAGERGSEAVLTERHTWEDLQAVLRRHAGEQPSPPGLADRLVGRRRIRVQDYLSWFGSRDGRASPDPEPELAWLHDEWPASTGEVAEVLCGAFLADLRDDFANRRLSDEWSLNCLLLVDHVDEAAARAFLSPLVRQRIEHRERTTQTDPLTVVAAGRGDLRDGIAGTDRAELDLDDLTYPELRRQPVPVRPWLFYRLPALTGPEVRALVNGAVSGGRRQRMLTVLVRGLTDGHPAAVREVLKVVTRQAGPGHHPARTAFEPATWLAAPATEAAGDPRTVEDLLREQLLDGLTAQATQDLITLSPARDAEQATRLADRLTLPTARFPSSVLAAVWPGGNRPSLTRRLLLRRLAERPMTVSFGWSTVHNALVTIAGEGEMDYDERYDEFSYELSRGRFAAVVEHLEAQLPVESAATWLEELRSITLAPRRAPGPGSPFDELSAEVQRLPPNRWPVARILAGRWILDDPLTGTRRAAVHREVAASFGQIAHRAPQDGHLLHDEQARHNAEAEMWE